MDRTQVVFVGGYGRSGSTIIDLLLNRVPGIVAVGEFRHLFGRALADNELCSCGKPFRSCEFWGAVLAEAFPQGFDRERIQRAVTAMNRLVMLPRLRWPRLMTTAMREDVQLYRQTFAAAYQAVAKIAGASVVVDSTKYPMHGWVLSGMPAISLSTMMLVRDPRAVAYSWQRTRLRPEVHWEKREMPRRSTVRSAFAWNLSNSITAGLEQHSERYRIQRYEDFIAHPQNELAVIASFILGKPTKLPAKLFDEQSRVPHTIAGNPVRIGSERVRVRGDDEWRTMPLYKRIIINILCFPGMRRYGYRLRSK